MHSGFQIELHNERLGNFEFVRKVQQSQKHFYYIYVLYVLVKPKQVVGQRNGKAVKERNDRLKIIRRNMSSSRSSLVKMVYCVHYELQSRNNFDN